MRWSKGLDMKWSLYMSSNLQNLTIGSIGVKSDYRVVKISLTTGLGSYPAFSILYSLTVKSIHIPSSYSVAYEPCTNSHEEHRQSCYWPCCYHPIACFAFQTEHKNHSYSYFKIICQCHVEGKFLATLLLCKYQ